MSLSQAVCVEDTQLVMWTDMDFFFFLVSLLAFHDQPIDTFKTARVLQLQRALAN